MAVLSLIEIDVFQRTFVLTYSKAIPEIKMFEVIKYLFCTTLFSGLTQTSLRAEFMGVVGIQNIPQQALALARVQPAYSFQTCRREIIALRYIMSAIKTYMFYC